MKTASDLLSEIQRLIYQENINHRSTKLLVAVSGGVDSMVLLDTLHRIGFPLVVAHVNHQTRGMENVEEEDLVKKYCEFLGVDFYSEKFFYEKGNFQEEARNFRYKFFRYLANEHKCQYITTAHHRGDQIETFFQALYRSSGLAGLSGMSILQGELFRPLLTTAKSDLYAYAKECEIPYREDRTNASDDYQRNLIRNKVIAPIENVLPDFQERAASSIRYLGNVQKMIPFLLRSHPAIDWVDGKDYPFSIDLSLLPPNLELKKTFLWYALRCVDVSSSQVEDMVADHVGPKYFLTKMFKIEWYQSKLFIIPNQANLINEVKILFQGHPLQISEDRFIELHYEKPEESHFLLTSETNLEPFSIRIWEEGDRMKPSGMAGQRKKVKKILQELKLPLFQRKKIPVLLDRNGEILWAIGIRTSVDFQNDQGKYRYFFTLR